MTKKDEFRVILNILLKSAVHICHQNAKYIINCTVCSREGFPWSVLLRKLGRKNKFRTKYIRFGFDPFYAAYRFIESTQNVLKCWFWPLLRRRRCVGSTRKTAKMLVLTPFMLAKIRYEQRQFWFWPLLCRRRFVVITNDYEYLLKSAVHICHKNAKLHISTALLMWNWIPRNMWFNIYPQIALSVAERVSPETHY